MPARKLLSFTQDADKICAHSMLGEIRLLEQIVTDEHRKLSNVCMMGE
jgi:hypothetical protein